MISILHTMFAAALAFAATNLDDLVVLVLLFSQAPDRRRDTIVGQYLGFSLLVLLSLPGFFGGIWVSKPWMGLLGILPIVQGIRSLFASEEELEEIQGVRSPWKVRWLSPQVATVAAVTVANGGDNISIYVPFFATLTWLRLGIALVTFYLMLGLWCWGSQWLAAHPTITPVLERYGHRLVPIVLIGLGLYILWENQSWRLLAGL